MARCLPSLKKTVGEVSRCHHQHRSYLTDDQHSVHRSLGLDKKNVGAAIKPGLTGAAFGFTISFMINYFLMPVPDSEIANAIRNETSGLISGFSEDSLDCFTT